MEGTRLRILQILQKDGKSTVDGLARTIGLAPATIRRHLDILQRDRLVDFEEVRKKTGRPEYSFYLTEEGQEALPKDYDRLLNSVVKELASLTAEDVRGRNGEQILEEVFRRLSSRLWEGCQEQVGGKDMRARVETLLKLLGQEDFFPEADVTDGKLRIKLLNCPFRSVALQNKAVCSFDAHLISSMLATDVSRVECVHDGDSRCMYSALLNDSEARTLSSALQAAP